MKKPIIKIHDLETDEVIEREMNAEEFAQYEKDQAIVAKAKADAELMAQQKSELLTKLGITAEEAKLLLS